MNVLALCAGVGGLELGVRLAVPAARTVCYVEREAYNAAVLVARMEGDELDAAPVWDDLGTFDGRAWRGVVDCVTAGFPCQPVSAAGKRLGRDDDRWLWPLVARTVRDVRPRYVFLENVPGLFHAGFGDVLGSLADLGFAAEWGVFSAAASGAPHYRRRFYLLAYTHGLRKREHQGQQSDQRGRSRYDVLEEVWPTPPPSNVCRVADGVPFRVDRLRALGNAVVPAVAARAWLTLAERLAIHA